MLTTTVISTANFKVFCNFFQRPHVGHILRSPLKRHYIVEIQTIDPFKSISMTKKKKKHPRIVYITRTYSSFLFASLSVVIVSYAFTVHLPRNFSIKLQRARSQTHIYRRYIVIAALRLQVGTSITRIRALYRTICLRAPRNNNFDRYENIVFRGV